ncbi:hypothetical protein F0P96_12810 [Hymenobacter busanensis]|uniref:Uncharacterized protein n=1 Tax=Hymenobacter busanensis TaxID=2607656 RepID=A0A7L4ZYK8_9BACT|nr:hypothetical protein [Hymenobacter busanensis]KAA9332351.1 hypothetical protein F0P96_12810 [Hymenobacter busanensis]QHJ07312.1 hypothetical protein GUY19_08465 [Hymenobacter busanensis]
MKIPALFSLLLLGGLALGSCNSDDETQTKPTGLVGTWSLNKLECYCPSGTPTPVESITFDAAGNVTEYHNGQVERTGTYQLSTGSTSCATNADLVTFSWATQTPAASYSIVNDVLVIDQGLCFDAPRKTYGRVVTRQSK